MSRKAQTHSVLPAALETVTGIAQCDHSSPAGAEAKGIIAATVTHFGSQWQLHDRQMTERGYMVKRYTWQAQNMRGKSAKQLMFRANERGLLPEKIVAAVMKVYGARQAAAGTPRHRGRSRSKQQLPGSSGSSKRSAETPGVRSSSKQVQGTKRQRVVAGASTHEVSASEGSGAESADDAPESSSDQPVDSSDESDLEHQALVKPSSTQQQQQQQGIVKEEQPTAKQQQGVQDRPDSALASPLSQQSPSEQQQLQACSKQQAPLKGEELGCAAARAWLAKARIEFAELQKLLAMSVDSKPQPAATVAAAGAGKRQRQH